MKAQELGVGDEEIILSLSVWEVGAQESICLPLTGTGTVGTKEDIEASSLSVLQDDCIELVDFLLANPVFGKGHFP